MEQEKREELGQWVLLSAPPASSEGEGMGPSGIDFYLILASFLF
jgi:hypothetical protein